MVNYGYKVLHTDKVTGVETDLTECVSISTDEGISSRVDSFQFNIYKNGLPVLLDCEDGIKIYFNGNLIMDGKITEYTLTISANGYVYLVKGQNKLEAVLNNISPYYTSSPTTASAIVTDLINKVNSWNASNVNGWVNIGVGEISATTYTFSYYQQYKPVFQMIEELSSHKYTQNGSYMYYLDSSNNFVWKPRPMTVSSTLTEGIDGVSIKILNGTWDAINTLVINAGADLNGAPIFAYSYNGQSIGKIGWKWKYISRDDIAKEVIDKNPEESNANIRIIARDQAKNEGQNIVSKLGTPRFKVEWEVRGTASYQKGNLYSMVIPTIGWTELVDKQLRLTDVKHTFNSKGWMTDLSFEEDEDAAIANL